MEKILNLTQHNATSEQINDGVIEPSNKNDIKQLLTFDRLPTRDEIKLNAFKLALIAKTEGSEKVMIGGAPFLMSYLEDALTEIGIKYVYSFSIRKSVEKINPDGTVSKMSVFSHAGWIQ